MPPGMPGGFMVGGMPGNMPFQIVNPQNPQVPTLGMFPMMQGLQMPGLGGQNPANKYLNCLFLEKETQINLKDQIQCNSILK